MRPLASVDGIERGNVEQPNQSRLAIEPRRPTTFEPGSTFGEYTIVRRIGRGGQGSVFEVRDGLGLSWALKVSEEMALHDANAEMRFAREARCVAENLSQLPRHSGVFVGEHYGVWDRRFYVKMKLLRGESLAQRLRRLGQLSIYEAVRIAERIAFAIGQAHAQGVLHRDLKPENIFLTESGEVVVLGLGLLAVDRGRSTADDTARRDLYARLRADRAIPGHDRAQPDARRRSIRRWGDALRSVGWLPSLLELEPSRAATRCSD